MLLPAGCERPPVATDADAATAAPAWSRSTTRARPQRASAGEPGCRTRSTRGAARAARRRASVYKNVQVLGDLSVDEFTRLMVAITDWVSPAGGLRLLPRPGEDLAADALYTKVVARRMIADDPAHQRRLEDPRRRHRASPATPATAASRCRRTSGSPIPGSRTAGVRRQPGRAERAGAGGRHHLAARRSVHAVPRQGDDEIRVQSADRAAGGQPRHSIKQTECDLRR